MRTPSPCCTSSSGPNETVSDARSRLGEVLSTETVAVTAGSASYVSPPSGPAEIYLRAIERVEKQIFKLVNLPAPDSHAPETADSRRIKAMGLNRILSRAADEAERFERRLARIWFRLTYGKEEGLRRYRESGLRISYPDEFFAQEVMETVGDALKAMSLGLGPLAASRIRKAAVPIVLSSLPEAVRDKIDEEIDAQPAPMLPELPRRGDNLDPAAVMHAFTSKILTKEETREALGYDPDGGPPDAPPNPPGMMPGMLPGVPGQVPGMPPVAEPPEVPGAVEPAEEGASPPAPVPGAKEPPGSHAEPRRAKKAAVPKPLPDPMPPPTSPPIPAGARDGGPAAKL